MCIRDSRLFCDGGMGSLLQAAGLAAGELPERWNLSHPEVITNVHRKYLAAGAEMCIRDIYSTIYVKDKNKFCQIFLATKKPANMPVYNKRGILLLPKVIVLNPKDGSFLCYF